MSNAPKTVLCIHDLPGFGRAGLSVIVPVLSALGAQAVAVPTAVLSTHTGGLGTPAKLAKLQRSAEHYLQQHHLNHAPCRLDAVLIEGGHKPEWVQNITG